MRSEKPNMRKTLYLLLSILVAASIWYVVDENGVNGNPRIIEKWFYDIPITYLNQDDLADRGLMLLLGDEEDENRTSTTVDLKLSGRRRRIAELDVSKMRLTVDLAAVVEAGAKNLNYKLSYTDSRFNDAFAQKDASIFVAKVNIGELYSKEVDVRCELVGNVAEGYTAGQVRLSHQTVELRGQEEDIDHVSYVKVKLDIGNAEETVTEELSYQYYDANDEIVEGINIHPTVDKIKVKLPVFVTKELQLTMDFLGAPGARLGNVKYKFEPATITVSGDASALKGVETIDLGEFDLLSLVGKSGETTHTFPITVPEGCQNLSGVTRTTLTISFKDMTSAQVTTDRFRYENLPTGKNVDVLTEEMTVHIFGTAADVAAVTGEQVTIVADLSDYAAALGSYTVPAVVEIKSGDVGVSGSYEVQLTIREHETENTGETQ